MSLSITTFCPARGRRFFATMAVPYAVVGMNATRSGSALTSCAHNSRVRSAGSKKSRAVMPMTPARWASAATPACSTSLGSGPM